jgi:hypothetical protein
MPVPGSEQDFVLDHEQALLRAAELGPRVVILDTVGHIEGIGLAELLASLGKQVTLAMPLAAPGNLDPETAAVALPRAVRAGARWLPSTRLDRIGAREVELTDLLSLATRREPADHVVIRTHGLPVDELYLALRDRVEDVVRVGDALAVRSVDRAIYDGHLAGRRL